VSHFGFSEYFATSTGSKTMKRNLFVVRNKSEGLNPAKVTVCLAVLFAFLTHPDSIYADAEADDTPNGATHIPIGAGDTPGTLSSLVDVDWCRTFVPESGTLTWHVRSRAEGPGISLVIYSYPEQTFGAPSAVHVIPANGVDSFDMPVTRGNYYMVVTGDGSLGNGFYAVRATLKQEKLDIVWRHQNGQLAVWYMDGVNLVQGLRVNPSPIIDTNWKIAGTGDFNNDGKVDILWQHQDGKLAVWHMDGVNLASAVPLNPGQLSDTNWKIAGTGDFNRDGKVDILWQHQDGKLAVWYMDGVNLASAVPLNPGQVNDTNWKIAGTGDFNRDGKVDILWQHQNGKLAAWYMDGVNLVQGINVYPSQISDTNWKIVGTGDPNRDGNVDILWQHQNGQLAVWYMGGVNFVAAVPLNPSQASDTNWRIVGTGGF
jgi:hypothetical protein